MKKLWLVIGAAVFGGIVLLLSYRVHIVTRIIDGDTIIISGYDKNIRLIGIDTAEKNECYRDESTKITADLLLGKRVRVVTDENSRDEFGRILGYVYLQDGTLVNKQLLEIGAGQFFYDSVNLKHQTELITATEIAHLNSVGYWKACGPCNVKGNYDIHGKRYYHLPTFRHYASVVVNLNKGDRWFCGEREALDAGFVRARE